MCTNRKALVFVALVFAIAAMGSMGAQAQGPDYATQIQPIFDTSCVRCHSRGGIAQGTGLLLISYEEVMKGTSVNGPVIIPGDADKSPLIWKLEGVDNTGASVFGSRMPQGGSPLLAETIQLIRNWINAGALKEAEEVPTLEEQLVQTRSATEKYEDVEMALADGYVSTEAHVPAMGVHYINFALLDETFDPAAPEALLYVNKEGTWVLVGVEYVVPGPVAPEGFTGGEDVWGVHEAACHYKDGTEIPSESPDACPATNPDTGAEFDSWHPDLQTLHVWLYMENPEGLFAELNSKVERLATAVEATTWGQVKSVLRWPWR